MCRIGVLLVAVVLLEFTWAGTQTTDRLLVQRFKRSPGYYGHHRHWPPPPDCWPPPPRDYWPPPPGPPPGPPPRPPPGPPERISEQEPFSRYSNEPCTDSCRGKSSGSGSISNAKSGTGDAIAVAVAKGQ